MYHLSFIEGNFERKSFFYHNIKNALQLQRELLIVEINNLVTEETGSHQFNIYDWTLCNTELQKLLHVLIELCYRDDSNNFQIKIEVDEIKFQDDVKVEDDTLLVKVF